MGNRVFTEKEIIEQEAIEIIQKNSLTDINTLLQYIKKNKKMGKKQKNNIKSLDECNEN